MKSHFIKGSLVIRLLVVATLVEAGCSQSPNSAAALAQAAVQNPVSATTEIVAVPNAKHEFVFKADKKWRAASVVGSFNKWNKTTNPMTVDADGLTWRIALPLEYGKYVYKFALFGPENEEKWVVDPNAPLDKTDKINDNSVLLFAPADYKIAASAQDGQIASSALLSLSGRRDVSYENGKITLSFRARKDDLSEITLKASGGRYPMQLVRTDDLYAYYKTTLPWDTKQDLTYSFELVDGKSVQQYGANGLQSNAQPFKIIAKTFQPYLLTDAPEPLKMKGPLTTQTVNGPAWAKNQPIYEVNLDVYNFPKGTALREYEKHLPILKEMGVGLIWFMPLHPRGYKKGYGSPYSVRDYTEINPDLGTKAEFKHLVETAHKLGLRVLMDWVPNHTSWDNALIETHPEFYVKDAKGEITQAYTWADVAQLDYGQPNHWNQPLWNMMRDNMVTWVRDFGVDGFRADVAGSNGKVPVEFWNWLRPQLDAVKPVFMLAEAEDANLYPAFDMTYSWKLPPVLWDISAGRKSAIAINEVLRDEALKFPDGAIAMRFLDNHDWHGHADWDWGQRPVIDTKNGLPQVAPFMVLCATLPGKPLLYNGQEMSYLKVLPPAQAEERKQSTVWPFYRSLMALYQSQTAIVEGSFSKIASDQDEKIYAFVRQSGKNRVLIVTNLSDQEQSVTLQDNSLAGEYLDWFSSTNINLPANPTLKLKPWAYSVYVAQSK